jgi:hypothetical protein
VPRFQGVEYAQAFLNRVSVHLYFRVGHKRGSDLNSNVAGVTCRLTVRPHAEHFTGASRRLLPRGIVSSTNAIAEMLSF